jgi:hypothetical protein
VAREPGRLGEMVIAAARALKHNIIPTIKIVPVKIFFLILFINRDSQFFSYGSA